MCIIFKVFIFNQLSFIKKPSSFCENVVNSQIIKDIKHFLYPVNGYLFVLMACQKDGSIAAAAPFCQWPQ